MNFEAWLSILSAGILAGLLPVLLRPILRHAGIVDTPNYRSSHTEPTIRGGGTAQLLALLFAGSYGATTLESGDGLLIWLIVGATACVGIVGLVEDLTGLPIATRLSLQMAIGAALGVSLSLLADGHWIIIAIAMIGFPMYVNFANFMDGVNSISGIHGLTSGTAFAFLGIVNGHTWLAVIGLLTAVVFVVFLPWNLAPPRMFLGDVGSYVLGGLLASTAITSIFVGIHVIAALAPLSIYVADTTWTLIRRALKGEPLHRPHREHVYQRLTDEGFSHVGVGATVGAFTLLASAAGLLVSRGLGVIGGLVMLFVTVFSYLYLPTLMSKRLRSGRGDVHAL